jgi:signal transduction histidine kinase/DNA-binding response OmpR family regulator/Tfp pilus assembly protein PilF
MMKFAIATVLLLVSHGLLAQDNTMDSLWLIYLDQEEITLERGYSGLGIAKMLMVQDPDSAEIIIDDVIELCSVRPDTIVLSNAYLFKGYVYYVSSDYDEAIRLFDSCLFYSELVGDPRGIVSVSVNMGAILQQQGEYAEALVKFEGALESATQIQDSIYIGTIFLNMGTIYLRTGEYQKGEEFTQKSLDYFLPIDHKRNIALAYNNLGAVHQEKGNHVNAIGEFHRSLAISTELNDLNSMAQAYLNIGGSYLTLGQWSNATEALNESLELYSSLSNDFGMGKVLNNLGVIHLDKGEINQAKDYFEQCLAIREKVNDQRGMALTLVNLGKCSKLLNNPIEAEGYFRKGIAIHRKLETMVGLVKGINHLIDFYNWQARYSEAKPLIDEQIKLSKENKLFEDEILTYQAATETYNGLRQYKIANDYLRLLLHHKDSMNAINSSEKLLNLKVDYELDKQSLEDSLAFASKEIEAELAHESEMNRQRKIYFALFIFLLIFAFIIYYRFNLKRKLNRAETLRLKELDDFKNKLYTNITHEFRTPLTVIMGVNDQIEGHDDERRLIRRNSRNLLRLVNQILDLSKLESGKARLNMTQGDIIIYLKYLIESFHSLAYSKKVNLTFYPDVEELIMDFDRDKVEIIISNLLSNAIKFTPEFGKVLVVAKSVSSIGGTALELRVIDSGLGIKKEDQGKIFDRYYQTENKYENEEQGTGIGLALTKELVELQGGSIEVKSVLEEGTEFSVLIPVTNKAEILVEEKPALAEIMEEGSIESQMAGNSDLPLLLIIEDNSDVMRYLKGTLDSDYQLLFARDGEQGIAVALEEIPELIISDVMMPKKDGFVVCETLKQDERTSHIPIILLTAKADYESRIQGLEHGADAYLAKPFQKDELLIRLVKLLELRKTLQQRFSHLIQSHEVLSEASELKIENEFLLKLKHALEENLEDSEFGIEEICGAVNLSRMQVHRKLKALTGITTTQFIRDIRLEHSLVLLKNPELSISEIAYEVGFSDPNYYSRSFTQKYEKTPSEFQKG